MYNKFGICEESIYPFVESKVNDKPTDTAYAEALKQKVKEYRRIPGLSSFTLGDEVAITGMKIALAKGYPVTISIKLGKTFYSLGSIHKLEDQNYIGVNSDLIGGHAMNVVEYDDSLDGLLLKIHGVLTGEIMVFVY